MKLHVMPGEAIPSYPKQCIWDDWQMIELHDHLPGESMKYV
jgi:hypothetical protein